MWKLCPSEAEEAHLKAKESLQILKKEQDDIVHLQMSNAELVGLALVKHKYKVTQKINIEPKSPI